MQVQTLAETTRRFARYDSPRVLLAGFFCSFLARLALSVDTRSLNGLAFTVPWFNAGWRFADVLAVLCVLTLVPFVEWVIHRWILHAQPRSFGSIRVDLGEGHRDHHLNPTEPARALLRGPDAAVFLIINVAIAVASVLVMTLVIGSSKLGPAVTGAVVASGGLLHYEWSHYLFHSKYQPRTKRYARLKRNHRLHHWRNENYWLGITTNLGDRAMRTLPANKSDVPRSATTRTLNIEPIDSSR